MSRWDTPLNAPRITGWYHEEMLDRVRKYLTPDSTVIDIGCGRGMVVDLLAPLVGIAVGVDSSACRIEDAIAETDPNANILYLVDSGDSVDAESESADVVCSLQVMQHLSPDVQQAFVDEAYRLLKPGGVYVWQTVEAYDGYVPNAKNVAHTRKECKALCDAFSKVSVSKQDVVGSNYNWLWVTATK